MGYTTDFSGHVTVEPPLNDNEVAFLSKFAETRRMDRERGPYFVDGTGYAGQGHDEDIRDFNNPPAGQPGLWCKWVPAGGGEDGDWTPEAHNDHGFGTAIYWSGAEKFYDAPEWMAYLIEHFLQPGGHAQGKDGFKHFTFDHKVNGVIEAQGEDPSDVWRLVVKDNVVTVEAAEPITYGPGQIVRAGNPNQIEA